MRIKPRRQECRPLSIDALASRGTSGHEGTFARGLLHSCEQTFPFVINKSVQCQKRTFISTAIWVGIFPRPMWAVQRTGKGGRGGKDADGDWTHGGCTGEDCMGEDCTGEDCTGEDCMGEDCTDDDCPAG
jgi:hypothetical protein